MTLENKLSGGDILKAVLLPAPTIIADTVEKYEGRKLSDDRYANLMQLDLAKISLYALAASLYIGSLIDKF